MNRIIKIFLHNEGQGFQNTKDDWFFIRNRINNIILLFCCFKKRGCWINDFSLRVYLEILNTGRNQLNDF